MCINEIKSSLKSNTKFWPRPKKIPHLARMVKLWNWWILIINLNFHWKVNTNNLVRKNIIKRRRKSRTYRFMIKVQRGKKGIRSKEHIFNQKKKMYKFAKWKLFQNGASNNISRDQIMKWPCNYLPENSNHLC